jgi:hypothetical protein
VERLEEEECATRASLSARGPGGIAPWTGIPGREGGLAKCAWFSFLLSLYIAVSNRKKPGRSNLG